MSTNFSLWLCSSFGIISLQSVFTLTTGDECGGSFKCVWRLGLCSHWNIELNGSCAAFKNHQCLNLFSSLLKWLNDVCIYQAFWTLLCIYKIRNRNVFYACRAIKVPAFMIRCACVFWWALTEFVRVVSAVPSLLRSSLPRCWKRKRNLRRQCVCWWAANSTYTWTRRRSKPPSSANSRPKPF